MFVNIIGWRSYQRVSLIKVFAALIIYIRLYIIGYRLSTVLSMLKKIIDNTNIYSLACNIVKGYQSKLTI